MVQERIERVPSDPRLRKWIISGDGGYIIPDKFMHGLRKVDAFWRRWERKRWRRKCLRKGRR